MTKRRKAANPMFSVSLTAAESTGIPKPDKPHRVIVCTVCGESGGTLVRVDRGVYRHKGCSTEVPTG